MSGDGDLGAEDETWVEERDCIDKADKRGPELDIYGQIGGYLAILYNISIKIV